MTPGRFPRHRVAQIIAGTVWFVLLVALAIWVYSQGLSLRQIMRLIYDFIISRPLAPVVYMVIYTLRPLTFFPAMWLSIAAGSLFGFGHGLVYALIGENLSANTAYALARFFRKRRDDGEVKNPRIAAFRRRLVRQAFPTVVVLRASFLPFDLVNYACGLLHVPWLYYMLGSLVGMLPPMITYVSFGATVRLPRLLSRQSFSPDQLIDAQQLMISGGLLCASVVIAVLAHRRRQKLAREISKNRNDQE